MGEKKGMSYGWEKGDGLMVGAKGSVKDGEKGTG
jgi:hypothetical protein